MAYSKQYLSSLSKENLFLEGNLEKALRLLDVLDFLFSDSALSPKLVLKGGTAINLIYAGLPRLSVDIDLDYVGALNAETVKKDRTGIFASIESHLMSDGYSFSFCFNLMIMKEFKYRIRDLRREKEATGNQLAEEVGLSQSAISCWERGISYPSIDVCFQLCKVFGVSMDYLLGLSDDKTPLDAVLTEQEKKDIEAGYYVFKDAKDLTPEQRKQIDQYIELLKSINKKQGRLGPAFFLEENHEIPEEKNVLPLSP
jgi:transcriptional regulator with XRE-family HTH domain